VIRDKRRVRYELSCGFKRGYQATGILTAPSLKGRECNRLWLLKNPAFSEIKGAFWENV
jgi:hypothetical protein